MPVYVAMYDVCHIVAPLHPVSQQFLDSFLRGDMSARLFQWFFSLPNSDYIPLAECILNTIMPPTVG